MSPTHGPLPVPRDQPGGGAGWEPPRQTPSLRARSGTGALAAPPLRTDDALSGQRPRPLRGRLSVPSKTPASTVAAAAPCCGPSAACGRGAGPRPRSLSSAASFLHRPWGSSPTPRLAPRASPPSPRPRSPSRPQEEVLQRIPPSAPPGLLCTWGGGGSPRGPSPSLGTHRSSRL